MEDYDLTRYWDGEKGKEIACLVDGRTGEETPVEAGEGIDLGFLSRMTGLRTLYLYLQPITDLKAVSSLTRLQILRLDFCAELRDLAGIGELRDLECRGLNGTAVQSLEGIQSLNRLREIDLNNTPVTDLSALGECDFSSAAENGGVKIWIPNIFEIRDWSFLERIPKFEWLSLGGIDPELWTEHVQGAQVIGFFGRFDTQKQMKTFQSTDFKAELEEVQQKEPEASEGFGILHRHKNTGNGIVRKVVNDIARERQESSELSKTSKIPIKIRTVTPAKTETEEDKNAEGGNE
jgi:Leucine-rich repeat (LRR) protein